MGLKFVELGGTSLKFDDLIRTSSLLVVTTSKSVYVWDIDKDAMDIFTYAMDSIAFVSSGNCY